eukprot:TRINITY_DN5506_c0_g1_i2.p1 TRINITY_DN5506_c0_g1~~TRINITY_DN5506_c0_g1_i2.p1  ORF type:complete len:303 (+),score=18.00 TRINITY_DN5506_c0_g1_i2:251-1159(+)
MIGSSVLQMVTHPVGLHLILVGLFGYGFSDMAKDLGAEVRVIGREYDQGLDDIISELKSELENYKPKLVTVVHCETPSGMLNPLNEIGNLTHQYGALLYVDFVSSAGGAELSVKNSHIDLGLLGSQKCLSLPPDLSVVTVSPLALQVAQEVKYVGYDALLPFQKAVESKYFPYTHNWRAIAAMNLSLKKLETEGYQQVLQRHVTCSQYCRKRIVDMGLKLYPRNEKDNAPTVTAVYVPTDKGWSWDKLNTKLKSKGVAFGGNYGKLKGVVFRIGHMGVQADLELLKNALDILESTLSAGSEN